MQTRITIGRAEGNLIRLGDECGYASGNHAEIYLQGNQLMYSDISTNGTLINGALVNKAAVPVNFGDNIMIANRYPLDWSLIARYLAPPAQPVVQQPVQQTVQRPVQQPVQRPAQQPVPKPIPQPAPQRPPQQPSAAVGDPNLTKWSWGAFVFSWIWGLFNGCWWILLVYIGLVIANFIPVVNFVASIASMAFPFYLGIKGRQLSWKNKQWANAAAFEKTQKTWDKVGIIFFILGIILVVAIIVIAIVFGAKILESMNW